MPVVHPIQDAQSQRTRPKARIRRANANARVGVGAVSLYRLLKLLRKSPRLQKQRTTNSDLPEKSRIAAAALVKKKQSRQQDAQTPLVAEAALKSTHNVARPEGQHASTPNKRKGGNGQMPRAAANGAHHEKRATLHFMRLWILAQIIAACWLRRRRGRANSALWMHFHASYDWEKA